MDEQAIKAMRSAIRRLEVAAERKGKRPTHALRIERLASRISALGMDMTTAAAVVAAIHAPYKPGVHRSLDAVLIRYIDWAAETGRSPLRIDEPGLMTFVHERGDHLGATPVRRFLAAWDTVAVPAGAKPSGSDVRPVAVRSVTLPPGKGGNTRRPRTAGPLPRDQPK
jgi:hypothetical protein